ncbi:MAG: class I SAM-dependent methyltransferase [Acidobacteriota bacterium]
MEPGGTTIGTVPRPACILCGSDGRPAYEGLTDRLYGAPGTWRMVECRNPDCRLLWLDPSPAAEDLPRLYESYFTHEDPPRRRTMSRRILRWLERGYLHRAYGYHPDMPATGPALAASLLRLHPGRRAQADAMAMHLEHCAGGRLLEVGVGNGETLRGLSELGWRAQGIDLDPRAVARARVRGLRVDHGTLEEQAFAGGSFDAVVSSHVIEHVPDPVGMLRECRRVLRRGGSLVVLTPNAESFGRRHFGADWRGLEPPRHLHLFGAASLAAAARKAGFGRVTCRSTERASAILLDSRRLRRGRPLDRGFSVRRRVAIETAFFLEWALCRLRPSAGEELLLLARD